jgi:hypothetical protein
MLASLRLLLALAATAASARAQGARDDLLDREIERACAHADESCERLRTGDPLERLLACAAEAGEEERWSFDLTGYWTDPPDEEAYGSAVLRADRGALHLEGRYNYEDIDTGSVFAGWTFAWSGDVEFSLVPMLGAVFGHTRVVAPGLELDLAWKILDLYAEAEYVFDAGGRDDSYFYLWSELTVNPTGWLSFGLVAQRTRAYDTDVDVDRGLLLGFHVRSVSATIYIFNLDRDDPHVMVGIGISF